MPSRLRRNPLPNPANATKSFYPTMTADISRRLKTHWNGWGSVTSKGIAWAVAIPTSWILMGILFLAHLRWALGRWPHFGETLPSTLLRVHHEVTVGWYIVMVYSLFAAAAIGVPCLFKRSWRPLSVYLGLYALGVALGWGALMAAPHPFLNWLFD
jgi:hypothetical protein